jgi:hypothetical protein
MQRDDLVSRIEVRAAGRLVVVQLVPAPPRSAAGVRGKPTCSS